MTKITHEKEPNSVKCLDDTYNTFSSLISALRSAQKAGFEYKDLGNQAVLPLLEAMLDIALQLKVCFKSEDQPLSDVFNQELVEKECLEEFKNLQTNQPTKMVWIGKKGLPSIGPVPELVKLFEIIGNMVASLIRMLIHPPNVQEFAQRQNSELFSAWRQIKDWKHRWTVPHYGRMFKSYPNLSPRAERIIRQSQFRAVFPPNSLAIKKLESWLQHVDGIEKKNANRAQGRISSPSRMSHDTTSPVMKTGKGSKASHSRSRRDPRHRSFLLPMIRELEAILSLGNRKKGGNSL